MRRWPSPVGSPDAAVTTMAAARAEAGPGMSIVGVIGSPVAHSLSPLLHTTAFAGLGLSIRHFFLEAHPVFVGGVYVLASTSLVVASAGLVRLGVRELRAARSVGEG